MALNALLGDHPKSSYVSAVQAAATSISTKISILDTSRQQRGSGISSICHILAISEMVKLVVLTQKCHAPILAPLCTYTLLVHAISSKISICAVKH